MHGRLSKHKTVKSGGVMQYDIISFDNAASINSALAMAISQDQVDVEEHVVNNDNSGRPTFIVDYCLLDFRKT